MTSDGLFYRRWIAGNAWSEALGLGTTFVLGRQLAPMLDQATSVWAVVAGAATAVLLGVLLEGVVVGFAQASVLRRRLTTLPRWAWVLATAVGAGIAWTLGMVPSTIMALRRPLSAAGTGPPEPSVIVQYALAGALGAVTGPILGLAQWTVLRRYVKRAARWLGANALAWGVGIPLIFIGMDVAPWAGPPGAIVLWLYAVCGLTGSVVGAIHGRVLVGLTIATPLERHP